jgi:hypothetical protein
MILLKAWRRYYTAYLVERATGVSRYDACLLALRVAWRHR